MRDQAALTAFLFSAEGEAARAQLLLPLAALESIARSAAAASQSAAGGEQPIPEAVQRLYHAGGAGPHTLALLQALGNQQKAQSSQQPMCASVEELAAALKQAYGQQQNALSADADAARRAALERDRQALIAYITAPECLLFSELTENLSATERDLDELLFSTAPPVAPAATGEAAHALSLVPHATAPYSTPNTIAHCQYLDSIEKKFQSLHELSEAVRAAEAEAQQLKPKILAHLNSDKSNLLATKRSAASGTAAGSPTSAGAQLTPEDVDRLYREGGCGPRTLAFISAFEGAKRRYPSVDALIAELRAAWKAALARRKADIAAITAYLRSPACRLFTTEQLITEAEVGKLLDEGRTASGTIAALQYQDDYEKRFAKFADVIPVVRTHIAEATARYKPELQQFLSDAKLYQPQIAAAFKPSDITPAVIDRLYETDRAGPETLQYVKKIVASQKIGTMDSLSAVVRHSFLWGRKLAKIAHLGDAQKKMLVFLWKESGAGAAGMLPVGLEVTPAHVDRLIAEGKAEPFTLNYLEEFKAAKRKFASFDQLVEAVRLAHEKNLAGTTHCSSSKPLLLFCFCADLLLLQMNSKTRVKTLHLKFLACPSLRSQSSLMTPMRYARLA